MINSDIVLLIICCILLGIFIGVWGLIKLIKYGIKNSTIEELRAKFRKSLQENGGELKSFDWNSDEEVFEIKFCFPGLVEKFERRGTNV